MSRPPKNYRWWQDHGDGWREEVDARKARMPIYHLQEIFLEEYFSELAPARVLEFGCGFGRHLEYLRRIPKLEVYGFDQSQSMVDSMRWAPAEWREERVRVGKPLNKLPYADAEFDVVLTVSVLIHVRPRDLEKVLSELVRVSKGHLIHIENNETDETFMTSDAHDGCWAHDLRAAYASIAPDMSLEVAPKMFDIEDVYQVRAPDVAAPRLPTRARASRFLDLDRSLSAEVERLQRERAEAARRRDVIAADLRERVETVLARAQTAEERVGEHLERAQSAESRLAAARDQSKTLRDRVGSLEDALRSVREECEALRVRARKAEDVQAELLDRARSAEGARGDLLERARDAEKARAELQTRARAAEERIEPLLDRATHAEGRMADLEERFEAAVERARRAELEVQTQRERARAAEARSDSLTGRVVELRSEIGSLVAARDSAVQRRAELEEAMRGVWDREEADEARIAELLERVEFECHRADRLDEAVMRAEATEERIVAQERDAQSRVIALRRRAERAEAVVVELRERAVGVEQRLVQMRLRAETGERKADDQRRRARKAESDVDDLNRQLHAAGEWLRVERQRADEALGRIDAARQARLEAEAELARVRSELAALLGR